MAARKRCALVPGALLGARALVRRVSSPALRAGLLLALAIIAAGAARAEAAADWPQVGDCAMFREGGGGRVLRAPSYWLRGTVVAVTARRHQAGLCPFAGKRQDAMSRADWRALVEASPCVSSGEAAREVEVPRVSLALDAWETPWTKSHGSAGMLFRGYFIDVELVRGARLDIDALWLSRCESAA